MSYLHQLSRRKPTAIPPGNSGLIGQWDSFSLWYVRTVTIKKKKLKYIGPQTLNTEQSLMPSLLSQTHLYHPRICNPWLLQKDRFIKGTEKKNKFCLPIHRPEHRAGLPLGFNTKSAQDILIHCGGGEETSLKVKAVSNSFFFSTHFLFYPLSI